MSESKQIPSFGQFIRGEEGGSEPAQSEQPTHDSNVKPTAQFKPIKSLELGKHWSPEEKEMLLKMPVDRNYIIGYSDMKKLGKTFTDVDRVAVLHPFLASEGCDKEMGDVMKREITIVNRKGEEWVGKVTEVMEVWKFDGGWFLLPPSSDATNESERMTAVLEAHNKDEGKEWESGSTSVKERSRATREAVKEGESEEKKTPMTEEEQKKMHKELFEDENVQKLTHLDLQARALPWFVVVYMLPESLKDNAKDRGIMRVFGPFQKQEESSKFIKALAKSFPHACVRGTQQFHMGALETGEATESEEFIFADKQIEDWVKPAQETREVAENFDSLLTDNQRLYREMCEEQGVVPKIVEDGGGKILEMHEESE
jgi:hypothetical protein